MFIQWFINQFVSTDQRAARSPMIRCATADGPSTSLILGEYDMLRDEGLALVRAIKTAGGSANATIICGGIHNSVEFGPRTIAGEKFIAQIVKTTRTCTLHADTGQR